MKKWKCLHERERDEEDWKMMMRKKDGKRERMYSKGIP